MQLKHIEYFVKTSEYKSFNEAAKNLFISQPSLSAAIATLEKELGYPLFTRSKNGIALTSEGKKILPDAIQMLEMQQNWLDLAKHTFEIKGDVRITAPDIICSTVLLDTILAASNQYPSLQITLKDESPKLAAPIETNQFLSLGLDFCEPAGFISLKKKMNRNHFALIPIADLSGLIFLNASHPFAKQKELTLEQLTKFHLVTYEKYRILPYEEIYTQFPKTQIKKLPTREMMFNLIARNPNYIGMFSSICLETCPQIKNKTICAKAIQNYPMPIKLVLIFPQNQKDNPLLQVMKELLLESCQKLGIYSNE